MTKNSKGTGIGKFIAGAAIGAGLGLLFAPKSGKETRAELSQKLREIIEQAKELDIEEVKVKITKKVEEIKKELQDLDKEKVLKAAKKKAKDIQRKAEELYELAIEKGTPILQQTTKELKLTTAQALQKIVDKLEEE